MPDLPDPLLALPRGPLRPVVTANPPWCRNCRHRGTGAFVDLSESELAFMTRFKRAHAIASAGEVLIRQGGPSDCRGILYSGMAARYRSMPTGERQLLGVLLSGDLLGFETEPGASSWCTVEALTDVSVCLFDPDRWDALLAVPSLAAKLYQRRSVDMRQLGERFAAVAACDPARALAHFLVDIQRRLHARGLGYATSFTLPLTRKQLSEALGITKVHLHRVLRQLGEQGIMSLEGSRVIIRDAERLEALAAVAPQAPERQALL